MASRISLLGCGALFLLGKQRILPFVGALGPVCWKIKADDRESE